jgi:hypothetical protein
MATYSALAKSNLITTVQALKVQAFDKMLQMRALPESIFFKLGGNIIDKMTPIPATWLLKMPPSGEIAHQTNFPMLQHLSGQENTGNLVDALANVEDPIIKEFTAYYNDVSKTVKLDQYGINYLDTAPYNVKEKIADLLSDFWKELMDYYMQTAILFKYSPNLLQSPTNLTAMPHPNTFVKGLDLPSQPWSNYNDNPNFFSSVIAASMDEAVANHTNRYEMGFDVPFALAMAQWASFTGKLSPFNFGGRGSYIYALPSSQVTRALNPGVTNSFGAVWQATTKLNTEEASLPLVLGRCRNVIFVENPRAPTARTFGSGSGSGTGQNTSSPANSILSVSYLRPGDNDQRYTTGNYFEAGYLMGVRGIAEVDAGVHTEVEVQAFKQLKATGMFDTMGFNRVEYDLDTVTNSSISNFSSAVSWFFPQTQYFNVMSGETN